MANILGKRKRRADLEPAEDISTHNTDDTHLRLLLQKHFEAKYEPLETSPLPKAVDLDTESQSASEDEADWNGLSDTEDHLPVETIEHVSIHSLELAPKEELKTFMVSIQLIVLFHSSDGLLMALDYEAPFKSGRSDESSSEKGAGQAR